jgi:hypothetical protein
VDRRGPSTRHLATEAGLNLLEAKPMAQCQHDGCTCNVHGNDKYCSEECRTGKNAAYCTCKHPDCGGKK